jgi:hypothetical protein
MSSPTHSPPERTLAEGHIARVLSHGVRERVGAAAECARPAEEAPSVGALAAYAMRRPEDPVDLGLARHLRRDVGSLRRYRNILAGLARAHSPIALAAATPEPREVRRIGNYEVAVVDDAAGSPPVLVIAGPVTQSLPSMIEVHHEADIVRLALPPPVGERILVVLAPEVAETALLSRLVRRPDCRIYLL